MSRIYIYVCTYIYIWYMIIYIYYISPVDRHTVVHIRVTISNTNHDPRFYTDNFARKMNLQGVQLKGLQNRSYSWTRMIYDMLFHDHTLSCIIAKGFLFTIFDCHHHVRLQCYSIHHVMMFYGESTHFKNQHVRIGTTWKHHIIEWLRNNPTSSASSCENDTSHRNDQNRGMKCQQPLLSATENKEITTSHPKRCFKLLFPVTHGGVFPKWEYPQSSSISRWDCP